ncbi:hypothetical protein IMG5_002410 [Ichthyophthirius multifiliis]|uniref:Tetratricopeptide repeat protein n=1 Tax=Ichthyophthirius multifiliis TaxID=5932 RepID=G0QJ45_ICHMU|nr:hypothetical protein IMG5_002410 [Ichthyophthirius multifiliis]EGR34769.1 hypothetical protein IMG5_002410 [Ichthyophthirius multifiliis]|eukprot:XP_004040073.1 hypothetical protein IMG5_002410 [Ichthyophthirius multifiliis]
MLEKGYGCTQDYQQAIDILNEELQIQKDYEFYYGYSNYHIAKLKKILKQDEKDYEQQYEKSLQQFNERFNSEQQEIYGKLFACYYLGRIYQKHKNDLQQSDQKYNIFRKIYQENYFRFRCTRTLQYEILKLKFIKKQIKLQILSENSENKNSQINPILKNKSNISKNSLGVISAQKKPKQEMIKQKSYIQKDIKEEEVQIQEKLEENQKNTYIRFSTYKQLRNSSLNENIGLLQQLKKQTFLIKKEYIKFYLLQKNKNKMFRISLKIINSKFCKLQAFLIKFYNKITSNYFQFTHISSLIYMEEFEVEKYSILKINLIQVQIYVSLSKIFNKKIFLILIQNLPIFYLMKNSKYTTQDTSLNVPSQTKTDVLECQYKTLNQKLMICLIQQYQEKPVQEKQQLQSVLKKVNLSIHMIQHYMMFTNLN